MSALMLQEIATSISIPIWGMSLTGLAVIAAFLFPTLNIIKANKKDTKIEIEKVETSLTEEIKQLDVKKVDMKLFEKTCFNIEDKVKINQRHVDKRLDGIDKRITDMAIDIKTLIKLHTK